ncbi:MAG TPA: vWA domain-containing protein [Kofleriaceae bacterium]|nr:vWA domain-containing protein [Kofleriaceae bacterium]
MRMVSRSLILPLLALGLPVLSGCPDRDVSAVDPNQSKEQQKEIPVSLNRDIDILFLVDDSGSMRQEQESLASNFPLFINVLESIEGGLPNIHLGVISSNVGTGPVGGGGDSCAGNGDNGNLILKDGCPALSGGDLFIKDVLVDEETGTREFNYTGDLATQFSCMAQLGTTGCGFEQHLESMKRALDPGNSNNTGFLRDDAFLAVIFIQDEDDCSTTTEGREMFDPSQDDRDAPLGEVSSFRCFEFGTTCEPASERDFGPRDNCVPGDDDTDYMEDTAVYVDFLKGLKSDPSKVIVAGIMGDRENADGVVVVGEDTSKTPPELWVEPVCVVCPGGASSGCPLSPTDPDGALVAAAASIRMRAFLDAFPQRSTWQNICNYDPAINDVNLSGALVQIATLLKKVIGSPCLEGKLAMPLDCRVSDVANLNQDNQEEFPIPSCDDSGPPCWRTSENRDQCPDTDTGLVIEIDRGGSAPPDNTTVVVRCLVE